jgi:hypothetical protein
MIALLTVIIQEIHQWHLLHKTIRKSWNKLQVVFVEADRQFSPLKNQKGDSASAQN